MIKFLITLLIVIVVFPVDAYTVYKKVNENGKIEYSDKPFPGAFEVKLPPVNSQDAPPLLPPIESSPTPESLTVKPEINIVSPNNGDSIRSNPGELTIMVQTTVPDDQQYFSQLIINNKPYLKPFEGTVLQLKNLDRGIINIKVQLQSSVGNVLATSKEIVVYMHKATINRAN